jgi:hypothetical protein
MMSDSPPPKRMTTPLPCTCGPGTLAYTPFLVCLELCCSSIQWESSQVTPRPGLTISSCLGQLQIKVGSPHSLDWKQRHSRRWTLSDRGFGKRQSSWQCVLVRGCLGQLQVKHHGVRPLPPAPALSRSITPHQCSPQQSIQ